MRFETILYSLLFTYIFAKAIAILKMKIFEKSLSVNFFRKFSSKVKIAKLKSAKFRDIWSRETFCP